MKNYFFAKTANQETIQQHTDKLLSRYYEIRSIYPYIPELNWDALKIACIYHDFGKINSKFQNKIMNKLNESGSNFELLPDIIGMDEVPHGYLSCSFLEPEKLKNNFSDEEIMIIYQAIYYHHNREAVEGIQIQKIVNEDMANHFKTFKYNEVVMPDTLKSKYLKWIKNRITKAEYIDNLDVVRQYIKIKGLLNKIDYSASGDIAIEKSSDKLYEKTINFFDRKKYNLNELQEYMIKNQNNHNIVIASTGIGKTEAALLWIGNNKGFFTLPLKVSINAIYDRIINEINHDSEKIGLLHSDTKIEYISRNLNLNSNIYNHTKQLSMPLTICTLDQLIDFVFKFEGYEMKLATLSYSKLVIDEIQMYSPEMLGYLILALKEIHEMGGKFCIMTATLPPIFLSLLQRQISDFNFSPKVFIKKNNNISVIRHKIKIHNSKIETEDILSNIKNKKVLVIVNTVKKAQELYEKIKRYDINVNLLHSRFTKEHRKIKEEEILKQGSLVHKEECIWVTTQIVEASLDIDFDILYTELSDLSGLFQRMGRVYRGREFNGNEANIHIYVGEKYSDISGVGTGNKPIIDREIFLMAKDRLLSLGESIITEEEKMSLVEDLYSEKNMKGTTYYKKIWQTISTYKDIKEYELQKSEVSLREIDTKLVIPIDVYKANQKEIDATIYKISLTNSTNKKILLKENIMKYTLTIPGNEFKLAYEKGFCAETLALDTYTFVPVIDYAYDDKKGLFRRNQNLDGFCEETQFA